MGPINDFRNSFGDPLYRSSYPHSWEDSGQLVSATVSLGPGINEDFCCRGNCTPPSTIVPSPASAPNLCSGTSIFDPSCMCPPNTCQVEVVSPNNISSMASW